MLRRARLGIACALGGGIFLTSAFALQGPEHKSLRPLSMGNAFVALAEGREALHYNPAGLNRLPASGDAAARMDAHVGLIGADAPWAQTREGWGYFQDNEDSDPWNDSTLAEDVFASPGRPSQLASLQAFELATHDFGAAYWGEAVIYRGPDFGVLLPGYYYETVRTDVVLQVSGSRGFFDERLALGAGYRLASRSESGGRTNKSPQGEVLRAMTRPRDFNSYGHGLDFGLLWRQNSWLQFGAAAQNVFMNLNGEAITPEITVGAAVNMPWLSSSGPWERRVNLAADYEDAFDRENNYKPLSKVNFGAEVEQGFGHFLAAGLGGGFKGGYWTAGARMTVLSFLHLETASWAEELGTYTGEDEDRHYAFVLSAGI
jgi:hypothetical protein